MFPEVKVEITKTLYKAFCHSRIIYNSKGQFYYCKCAYSFIKHSAMSFGDYPEMYSGVGMVSYPVSIKDKMTHLSYLTPVKASLTRKDF